MARKVRDRDLGDRASRAKLNPRGKPHWRTLDQGLHLGYRKNKDSGKWVVRVYQKGAAEPYRTHTLPGVADDRADADNKTVFSFFQAQDRARQWAAEQQRASAPAGFTVSKALDQYQRDLHTRSGDIGNVRRVRRHLPNWLAQADPASLEAADLRRWRDGLAEHLEASTVNRVCAGLMAALNLAAGLDKRIANNVPAWRFGLQAIRNADQSHNVILPEPVIRRLIELAAAEGDEFQLLVETLAVTGAGNGQAARLQVRDLQDRRAEPRLMMPVSRKGRGEKQISHRPVPIPSSLAAKLRATVKGRPLTDPLLLKPNGEPWERSDHARLFAKTVQKAGLDPKEVTAYSLRHSSIVRQLLGHVPLRVCAAHHDTSAVMLERVYSAHIGDHADALTRAALLDVSVPPAPLMA